LPEYLASLLSRPSCCHASTLALGVAWVSSTHFCRALAVQHMARLSNRGAFLPFALCLLALRTSRRRIKLAFFVALAHPEWPREASLLRPLYGMVGRPRATATPLGSGLGCRVLILSSLGVCFMILPLNEGEPTLGVVLVDASCQGIQIPS
jgi:hypothetical protein